MDKTHDIISSLGTSVSQTKTQLAECMRSLLQKLQENCSRLWELYPEWKANRDRCIARLAELADRVDKVDRDVRTSQLAGSCAGVVGGGLAIAGIIAIPITAGTSLALTIAGAVVGTVGALVVIGSSLAGHLITQKHCRQAQECIHNDYEKTRELERVIETVKSNAIDISKLQADYEVDCPVEPSAYLGGVSGGARTAMDVGISTGIVAKNSGYILDLAKVVSYAGLALNTALIFVDVVSIIWHCVQFSRDDQSEITKGLHEKVKSFTEHQRNVETLFNSLNVRSSHVNGVAREMSHHAFSHETRGM